MKQIILCEQKARDKIVEGVNLCTNIVKRTLGPSGKNILINIIHGKLRATKDGITVINEISHDDPLINSGVKYVREASQRTAEEAGDSTTSTAILVQSMVNDINELIKAGKSAIELRKGIEKASETAVAWIKNNSLPVNGNIETIRAIATISSNNNEEIGNMIAQAFKEIGPDGVITLEESKTGSSSIEVLGGYFVNKGMVSPYFMTDPVKQVCTLNNPLILLYDKKITKINDILTVLEISIQQQRPILIIAASCEGDALGTLLKNLERGLQACVVFAPENGLKRQEIMSDIAIFTGGQVITEEQGRDLEPANFKPEYLGSCQKAIIKRNSTVIVNGQGLPDDIENRQKQIKQMIADAPSDLEKEFLRKRAGSIGKGVAILSIGAATDIEQKELKDLAEDAILSTRGAIEEGYLPGGAKSFLNCAENLISENISDGELIVYWALSKPFQQLLINAEEIDIKKIGEQINTGAFDYGYNAKTGEFCNLIQAGIIDASKVIRCAIINACSVAAQFCSTEVLISEIPE